MNRIQRLSCLNTCHAVDTAKYSKNLTRRAKKIARRGNTNLTCVHNIFTRGLIKSV